MDRATRPVAECSMYVVGNRIRSRRGPRAVPSMPSLLSLSARPAGAVRAERKHTELGGSSEAKRNESENTVTDHSNLLSHMPLYASLVLASAARSMCD